MGDLQRLGLVPTAAGFSDPDGNLIEASPQFDNTSFDPMLQRRRARRAESHEARLSPITLGNYHVDPWDLPERQLSAYGEELRRRYETNRHLFEPRGPSQIVRLKPEARRAIWRLLGEKGISSREEVRRILWRRHRRIERESGVDAWRHARGLGTPSLPAEGRLVGPCSLETWPAALAAGWPEEITVTQRIEREDAMLATPSDEVLAQDAEQLAAIARELFTMAARWQARFPSNNILKETVDAFVREALSRA